LADLGLCGTPRAIDQQWGSDQGWISVFKRERLEQKTEFIFTPLFLLC